MLKIKILCIGKSKEKWLIEAIKEYEKRLKPFVQLNWLVAKDLNRLLQLVKKEKSYICLDEKAKLYTSEQLSQKLMKLFIQHNSQLTFVIGGAEGLSQNLLAGATEKISLSKLTFTHQIVRLIFFEQLYRSFEIMKGSSYQK